MQGFIREDIEMMVNNEFKFPSNIKQVGNIDDRMKIYIEDYAHMYIQQYCSSGIDKEKEKIAALLGKYFIKDGQQILIISGVIQSKFSIQENGMQVFSNEDWKYIEEQKNIFFQNLNIIGWLHSQPGYGVFLNSADLGYHMEKFNKSYQVLLLIDPIEKMDMFFMWNEFHDNLSATAGYFIYYDKNEEMQEYMVENRMVKMPPLREEVELEEKEDAIVTYRRKDRVKRNKELQLRKMTNMLASLSAILFLISFVLGANLIQNGDRISKLENEISTIDTMYKNLMISMKSENITPVFAGQDMPANSDLISESDIDILAEASELESVDLELNELKNNSSLNIEAEIPIVQELPEEPAEDEIEETLEETDEIDEIDEVDEVDETPVKKETAKKETTKQETTKQETAKQETAKQVVTPQTIPSTYVIQAGDNLSYISVKFYGTDSKMKEIMELNGITDPNTLYSGKKIKLPRK